MDFSKNGLFHLFRKCFDNAIIGRTKLHNRTDGQSRVKGSLLNGCFFVVYCSWILNDFKCVNKDVLILLTNNRSHTHEGVIIGLPIDGTVTNPIAFCAIELQKVLFTHKDASIPFLEDDLCVCSLQDRSMKAVLVVEQWRQRRSRP